MESDARKEENVELSGEKPARGDGRSRHRAILGAGRIRTTVDRRSFEQVVAEALDRIPESFAELLDNVAVQVEDEPDDDTLRELDLVPGEETLYGLYTGVPLDARGDGYSALPDVIRLYRLPLVEDHPDHEELIREIQLTLLHEIGHHLGFGEEEMQVWDDEFEPLPADGGPSEA